MEFSSRPGVDLYRDGVCLGRGQGDTPEPAGAERAANEKAYLVFRIPLFRQQPLSELELVVTAAGGL